MFRRNGMFEGAITGMFGNSTAVFGLAQLQADPNCILIQDPSAIWGGSDHLPRRNLLLATDTLATQNVTVTAEAHTLYLQGTGSVTLSGTGSGTLQGTGANDRVSLAFTPTAGTLTLTVSGTVTFGMLCKSSVTDRSYQKITDWVTEQYAWAAAKNVPWLRRNRFLNTATLSTQTVTAVMATPLTVSFTGTGTITFSTAYSGSLVGTGASDRVSVTFTPAAGNLVCTVTGSVTLAQCEVGSTATPYQEVGASWAATYTALALAAGYPISLYSDRAGTTATVGPDDPVGKLLDLSGDNNHATAPSDAARPNLRLDGNGKFYLDRDTTDDDLQITWPTNLTTTGVIYTATGDYTTKDSGLTLSGLTSYKYPQRPSGDYGRIVMASESKYDAKIIKYLDAKRGRSYLLGPELWNAAAVTLGGESTQVSSGVYRIYSSAGTFSSVASNGNICTAGKSYLISFVVDSVTVAGSGVTGNIVSSADPNTNGVIRPSKVSAVMLAGSTGTASIKRTAGVTDIQVSNISVREVLL